MIYDYKKAPFNGVIVKVEEQFDSKVKFKSLELDIDHEFAPTDYARIYGEVVAVTDKKPLTDNLQGIDPIVQVGDKIYFKYLVTLDDSRCIFGNYYMCPYPWIFCVVRNGDIIPVGGWVLCDIIESAPVEQIEINGVKLSVDLDANGLVTNINKKKETNRAIVRHIGAPLEGDTCEVSVGDEVILADYSNFTNKIEGKDYYLVEQKYILCKV